MVIRLAIRRRPSSLRHLGYLSEAKGGGPRRRDTVLEVLASTSFLEKVFLLVMGAALTGIIGPVVKFRMDQSRLR